MSNSVKLEQLKAKWTYHWERGIANQEQQEMQERVRKNQEIKEEK